MNNDLSNAAILLVIVLKTVIDMVARYLQRKWARQDAEKITARVETVENNVHQIDSKVEAVQRVNQEALSSANQFHIRMDALREEFHERIRQEKETDRTQKKRR